jgi:AAA ATPase domain
MLLGRESELDELERLIAGVRAGRSRALVVRGEAGVGKTALLAELTAAAQGCRIARAAGVESEMELPFAGLHALCAPMLGRLAQLPEPQRDALNTAFGLSAGPPPDRFMVGLAVLSLLADVAEEQPLLCIVDDAQWLDRVSAQTLGFVARRLLAERVGLLFGLRAPTGEHALEGLPELVLEGLSADHARLLLDSTIPGPLDRRVQDRILGEAGGNPLALLELPRGLKPVALAGGFGLTGELPLTGRIEQGYVRRLEPPARHPPPAAAGGGRAGRQRDAAVARRRAAGDRPRGGRAGPGGGTGGDRRARALPASAGALGRLPRRADARAARGPSRARRRDRRAAGPRSPRVASRVRRRRPRRSGGG